MPDIAGRRWFYLFLVLISTFAAVCKLYFVLRLDGLDPFEAFFLFLFAILFGWISISFWMAMFGAWAQISGAQLLPLSRDKGPGASRTAILMPVYNEDVARVFSGIQAIYDSVAATGEATRFDFYILSDSTDPAHWVAEEMEWQRLRTALEPGARLYYRHRHRNVGRKSGNIQDFCENWGALYDYMVVLDADSLMSGQTLAALSRLMDANPRAALIQAPARLVGRQSLFARMQQFASSVYGPTYTAGLAYLQGPDGNYWGHNAIIRVCAFMQAAGLPRLPGKAPFGGEIMSHDFVEAALLLRAGWEIWMAPELDGAPAGSYEEPPPTIYDYLKRDRRWCQGNLQHFRVALAQGLKMPSRLHLLMGVMSYLSSPLWLLLLLVSTLATFTPLAPDTATGLWHPPDLALAVFHSVAMLQLVFATAVMLYGPKLIGLAVALGERATVAAHGGAVNMLRAAAGEIFFSTLLAPIVMLAHCWFLLNLVLGIAIGWGPQQRLDRMLPFWFVVRQYGAYTLVGALAAWALYRFAPGSLGWFSPLLGGLLLAIPLVYLSSSLRLGRATARDGLFLVPSETGVLPVLKRTHQLLARRESQAQPDCLRLVLADAAVGALHLRLLREAAPAPYAAPQHLADLVAAARRNETESFSRHDWVALLSDPDSLIAARS